MTTYDESETYLGLDALPILREKKNLKWEIFYLQIFLREIQRADMCHVGTLINPSVPTVMSHFSF